MVGSDATDANHLFESGKPLNIQRRADTMGNFDASRLGSILVLLAIQVIVVLLVRKKYPNNVKAGCLVCLIAPGIGQFYIETKMSIAFFILIYGVVWKPLGEIISNPYILYVVTGVISFCAMYYRSTKKINVPVEPTICKECGNKLDEEINKCSSCGARY